MSPTAPSGWEERSEGSLGRWLTGQCQPGLGGYSRLLPCGVFSQSDSDAFPLWVGKLGRATIVPQSLCDTSCSWPQLDLVSACGLGRAL